TRFSRDWSSDVCSSDLAEPLQTLDDGPEDGALCLQRLRGREVDVDLYGRGAHQVRATSRISNTSMRSPSLMSLYPSRPIPHSNPATTSRTSSLKRRRDAIWPV